jgi:hypothetical protein
MFGLLNFVYRPSGAFDAVGLKKALIRSEKEPLGANIDPLVYAVWPIPKAFK